MIFYIIKPTFREIVFSGKKLSNDYTYCLQCFIQLNVT